MSLTKHTGHLVEGMAWSKERPKVAGWYWWRAESFYVGVRCVEIMKNSPQVLSAGLQTQDLRVSGDDAFLKGLPLDGIPGEWCPIPLPTEEPVQRWCRAGEVEALVGEMLQHSRDQPEQTNAQLGYAFACEDILCSLRKGRG